MKDFVEPYLLIEVISDVDILLESDPIGSDPWGDDFFNE